jgi:WD40 repeat protein
VALTEVATGRVLHSLTGGLVLHVPGVPIYSHPRRVAFSVDGKRVASSGCDEAVHVWEAETGRLVTTCKGHAGEVKCLAISPDGRWVVSANRGAPEMSQHAGQQPRPWTVQVWDTRTGQEVRALIGHESPVQGVAFSRDGRLLASASDGRAILWDTATWRELRRLEGFSREWHELVFNAEGTLLATAGNGPVTLWDVATGKPRHALRGPVITTLRGRAAFSADGRRLATAADREVKLWDVESGQEVLSLPLVDSDPAFNGVGRLAFSPDGRRLLAALRDGTVQYWDATPVPGR